MEEKDAEAFYKLRSDNIVMKYLDRDYMKSSVEALKMINEIKAQCKENTCIQWTVTLKEKDDLIGTICYWRIEKHHHRAEMGYMLSPKFHRQGIMQEAMVAVINYGFEKMGLHSIEAQTHPDNTASKALLLKNGFKQEGLFKENYFHNGKYIDTAVFSLLKN